MVETLKEWTIGSSRHYPDGLLRLIGRKRVASEDWPQ